MNSRMRVDEYMKCNNREFVWQKKDGEDRNMILGVHRHKRRFSTEGLHNYSEKYSWDERRK